MIIVADKLSEINLMLPMLDIFSGSAVRVLQWQPKASLLFESNRGVFCVDNQYSSNAYSLISVTLSIKPSLLLTPEYSFPYSILDEIINNNSKWPKKGAIWCLSMEGISLDDYKIFMHNEANQNCMKITCPINVEKNFVNALVYLYLAYDKTDYSFSAPKLIVMPQLKTQPSADKYNSHEGLNMSLGNTIYTFYDESSNAVFASLICADLFSNTCRDLFINRSIRELILFNPQLTFTFLHEAFKHALTHLLDYRNSKTIIISLNWASGTNVDINPKPVIYHGFSAIFINPVGNYINEGMIKSNYKKGLIFSKYKYRAIWHNVNCEHILSYSISSVALQDSHAAVTQSAEPVAVDFYACDGKQSLNQCIVDWDWLNDTFKGNWKTNSMNNHNNSSCQKCVLKMCTNPNLGSCEYYNVVVFCNSFFSDSIFNDPFSATELGLSGTYYTIPDNLFDADNDYNNIYEKREKLQGITLTLDISRLPIRFKKLHSNYVWIMGENTINIQERETTGECITTAWIIYIWKKIDIMKIRNEINKQYSRPDDYMKRNRVLFCYEDPVDGFTYVDTEKIDISDGDIHVNVIETI